MPRYPVKQPPEGYGVLREHGRYYPCVVTKAENGDKTFAHIWTSLPEFDGRIPLVPISYAKRADAVAYCERHQKGVD
jgi:hypothetical protein